MTLSLIHIFGSRDSIANPNIVLNTIVAEAFAEACDVLEQADDFDKAVHDPVSYTHLCQVYVLTKDEGGRHTPFFNNYRPQFYFRTTDVTGVCNLPEGTEMCMPCLLYTS